MRLAALLPLVLATLSASAQIAPHGPDPTGPSVVFETSMGPLACRLFQKESPIAVKTFLSLANGTKPWTDPRTGKVQHGKRFYDGIAIDRVVPDFVIQTGDITNDPSGAVDIGFRFPNETFPDLEYDRPGRLAFGNAGKDTNNSELFFTERALPKLNGGYTIIGQCDDAAVDRIRKIARVPRGAKDAPLSPVMLLRVNVR